MNAVGDRLVIHVETQGGPSSAYIVDPRNGALLGTVWMPAFAYLPFRTVQRFQAQQRRPQMQADLDALRAASAAQRCFEH
jgi:hypothetical protein